MTRQLPFFVVAFLIAVGVGCSSKTIIQPGTSTSSSSSGETPGRRESLPCKSGDTTNPIEAFDVNPGDETGAACSVENVLDDDGNYATISWPGPGTRKIAGHEVTGCMVAEFSDGVTLKSLSMKMRPVGNGCGETVCTPGADGCGSGWKISIFAGPTIEKLDWLQQLSLTQADFFEYRVVIYERFKAKFVAICRESTPVGGDSVAIDSVYGFCN